MKVKSKVFYWYAAFIIAYILLTLLPAPNHTTLIKYHLSPNGLRMLDLTLLIPIIVIYWAAFYGYHKLHRYSQAIRGNKDGRQVGYLTRGLWVLAMGLAFGSVLSAALGLVANHHPSFTGASVIIPNYFSALYILVAFAFLSTGARGLGKMAKTRLPFVVLNVVALAVIILGVVFCDLVARSHTDIRVAFHMKYSIVMLTLAIPYMYAWFLGLLAIVELYRYGRKAPGIVYRTAWKRLAVGLGLIIATNILLQYLSTLTSWTKGLSLGGLLLLLYVLLILLASSFIVVALSTKKLIRIEEA